MARMFQKDSPISSVTGFSSQWHNDLFISRKPPDGFKMAMPSSSQHRGVKDSSGAASVRAVVC
jgi:hypothetical protein